MLADPLLTANRAQAENLPRTDDAPRPRARIRVSPEDFAVDEILGFSPSGEGDHAWLHIRKRGANTEWASRQLGELAGVRPVDVGFAGLKDRHAVTSQWFSINLAGRDEPDWADAQVEGVEVLQATRSNRKLRRGALRGNHFHLVLRDVEGDANELETKLEGLRTMGVPNYFGEQRFGRSGGNLDKAWEMFNGGRRPRKRHERGLYLSAARSLLFNRVLAERVRRKQWNIALPGDVFMKDGGRQPFVPKDAEWPSITERVDTQEVHPTGPLWGRGESPATGEVARLEQEALAESEIWCQGLESAGLEQDRRALRLPVGELDWAWAGAETLGMSFSLSRGGYATTVLRELVELYE